jgi:hypothetical protein
MATIEARINEEWAAAFMSSAKSERLWERLMDALGPQGWSVPQSQEDVEALLPEVRKRWEDWSESVMNELADWHENEGKAMQSALDSLVTWSLEQDWSEEVRAKVMERWNEVQEDLSDVHAEQAIRFRAPSSEAVQRMLNLGDWRADVVDSRARWLDWVSVGFEAEAEAIAEEWDAAEIAANEALLDEGSAAGPDLTDLGEEESAGDEPAAPSSNVEGEVTEVDAQFSVRDLVDQEATLGNGDAGREETTVAESEAQRTEAQDGQDTGGNSAAVSSNVGGATETLEGQDGGEAQAVTQVEPNSETDGVLGTDREDLVEADWGSSSEVQLTLLLSDARVNVEGEALKLLGADLSQLFEGWGERLEDWGQTAWKQEWSAEEWNFLEALQERIAIAGREPDSGASRADRMAWDKQAFFADRTLRRAMETLEVADFQGHVQNVLVGQRGSGASDLANSASVTGSGRTDDANSSGQEEVLEGERVGGLTNDIAATPTVEPSVVQALSQQEEEALQFGVSLPEAEVVARRSDGNRKGGLRLRPIAREELERSILNGDAGARPSESAVERFAVDRGAPVTEGVEYKIQVGAFRNALPAALFAAFDPMWAQPLPNGITRYLAGSFDAYDPAVVARDAIRALGYSDAFVVRFVDGVRVVGASRPDVTELAEERRVRASVPNLDEVADAGPVPVDNPGTVRAEEVREGELPTRPEDIPTWNDVQGRVFSVQVGAFRGVPDRAALANLGTLTREDAGSDGWLRLFSGRFQSQEEAAQHRSELQSQGLADAFIVVYINGRRIPLAQASTTSVSPLPGNPAEQVSDIPAQNPAGVEAVEPSGAEEGGFQIELGVFDSTIPVRLANAILDAPLSWEIRSERTEGLTRYRTRPVDRETADAWLVEAQARGFANARLVAQ